MSEKKPNPIKSGRGGARANSGRKAGAPNKKTKELQEKVEKSGLTPLDYMLVVMRNGTDEKIRMSAAIAAAPYIHPRLTAIEHTGAGGGDIKMVQRIELVAPVVNSKN